MKTRNGFVSNSSTSSFIVIGVKLTPKIKRTLLDGQILSSVNDAGEQLPDKTRWNDFMDNCCDVNDNELGLQYYDTSETDLEPIQKLVGVDVENGITAKEIAEVSESIKRLLNIKTEPAIYSWTQYS